MPSAPKCTANNAGWNDKAVQEIVRIPKTANNLGVDMVYTEKSGDPKKRAEAIVKAVTNFDRPDILAQVSEDLGEAMVGINKDEIEILMAERGK